MEEKELVLKRANSAVVSRDFSLAARLYKSLLKDDTGNVELLNALGNVYVKSGDDERALLYYEQILTFHPDDFDALNAEGGIYRRLKKYNEAIKVLEKALETGKNNAVVNYTLGFTYKSMGNDQDAIECFESVIEDNPSDVLAYNHLGSIYAAQKQHQKSISIYKRGLQIDPNHPILQYNLAKSYEAIHDDSSAISAYETALRAKPGWVDAVRSYAELLLRHRKTKVAASLAKSSINLNPQNLSLRLLEGTIFLAQCNYEAAIDSFEKALKIDSENIEAYRLLSKAYEKADNFNGALKAISKADEWVRKSGEKNIAVEKQMASVLLSTGSFAEAKEKIQNLNDEAVSQGNPNEAEILDLNEQLCICNEDEEGADSFHKKIAATNSDYTKDIAHKGNRYFQLGKLEKAIQAYAEYLESNNKDCAYWVALGRVNEVLGNNVEALDNYSTALAFDPSNYAAEKYTKSLNQKMIMDDVVPIIEENKEDDFVSGEEVSIEEFTSDESGQPDQTVETVDENDENNENDENDQIDPAEVTFDEGEVDIFDIDDSVTPAGEELDLSEIGLEDEEQEGEETENEAENPAEEMDELKDSLADMKDDLQDMKEMLLDEEDYLDDFENPLKMEDASDLDAEKPQKNQMNENPFAIDEQPDISEENDMAESKEEKPLAEENLLDEVLENNENELKDAEEINQASEDALKAKEEALKASEEARKALEEAKRAAAEEARKAAEEAAERAAEETRRKLEKENKKQQEQLDALNEKLNKQLEEAKKLSESVGEAAEHAQKAASSAEKAWDAAQSAADAAQSANNAENYINQVAEEAAKNAAEMAAENATEKIQEATKELEEKLAQESSDLDDKLLNMEWDEEIVAETDVKEEAAIPAVDEIFKDPCDEEKEEAAIPTVDEILKDPCDGEKEEAAIPAVDQILKDPCDGEKEEAAIPAVDEQNDTAVPVEKKIDHLEGENTPVVQIPSQSVPVSQPLANMDLSAQNLPNFGNSGPEIVCGNIVDKVSDMLPVLGQMLENKEDAHKFEKEIKLFSQLKELGEYLPEDLRLKFLSGRMRLLLDYLIARLSGKPGLMMMTKSLRKAQTIGAVSSDVTADSESLSGRRLAKKVIFDLKIMASKLDDQDLAKALITEAQEVEKKL